MTERLKNKIILWLANGEKGISSETIAFAVMGIKRNTVWSTHPKDPDDFNRCLKLVTLIPEIKDHFEKVAELSPIWRKVIDNWDKLEKMFIDEVGFNWCNGSRASKTYKFMEELGCHG